jgi:hypothetical protein
MADVVVTVPKGFTHPAAPGRRGLAAWLAEGDPPGSTWSGTLWSFRTAGARPDIRPGERVYVLCDGGSSGTRRWSTALCQRRVRFALGPGRIHPRRRRGRLHYPHLAIGRRLPRLALPLVGVRQRIPLDLAAAAAVETGGLYP